jgi:hypothetical protein
VRSVSTIWNPTVYTGLRAVIGSWKMTEISLPRISRNSWIDIPTSSVPFRLAEPVARPVAGSSPSRLMDDWVFPEPDSPTIASTSPARSS